MRRLTSYLVVLLMLPGGVAAQDLVHRVAGLNEANLRLSFAARPGVCGNGETGITIMDNEDSEDWVGDCERGPVRVAFRVRSGRVIQASTHVGGHWRTPAPGTTDLGTLPAREAASALLALAEHADDDADDLIVAATLADCATVWPTLIKLARNTALATKTRRQAVFWLGQAAGSAATRGLDSIARDTTGDLEVRKHAVFALSQRPASEAVPVLIDIARTNRHPELRKTALFWLGQSEDPRAIALFEEILKQ
jgi:HEAT repeats